MPQQVNSTYYANDGRSQISIIIENAITDFTFDPIIITKASI
jgi:hypothetical protein